MKIFSFLWQNYQTLKAHQNKIHIKHTISVQKTDNFLYFNAKLVIISRDKNSQLKFEFLLSWGCGKMLSVQLCIKMQSVIQVYGWEIFYTIFSFSGVIFFWITHNFYMYNRTCTSSSYAQTIMLQNITEIGFAAIIWCHYFTSTFCTSISS